MKEFLSCKQAMDNCMESKTFAIAHLYKDEKTMDMHIHDCCEIYYSISGGKQFLIDNKFYSVNPGDIFVINQYESHCLSKVDTCTHERIVISIYPDYIKRACNGKTELCECFEKRDEESSHRVSLSKEEQHEFLYLINKIAKAEDYAHELTETAAFVEMMVLVNKAFLRPYLEDKAKNSQGYNDQVDKILSYINANISSQLSIETLSEEFSLSDSYICRIFKGATGTTVNKYITARRISIAKSLLSTGASAQEAFEQTGFLDYSSFFKAFTKAVGISPKKYAQCSNR